LSGKTDRSCLDEFFPQKRALGQRKGRKRGGLGLRKVKVRWSKKRTREQDKKSV